MSAYYNENDPGAAAWLRELIKDGLIAAGEVDERSIADVQPSDVEGFTQCHWFAGVGGWSYALRLAGWPDDRPCWTGSCPCQPWSDAGEQGGESDPRHLWPVWFPLINECRPATIFGEQVASKAALRWVDGVHADLEASGYAFGVADLCAAGVGAPHIRQRLFWVADSGRERPRTRPRHGVETAKRMQPGEHATDGGNVDRLANSECVGAGVRESGVEGQPGLGGHRPTEHGAVGGVEYATGNRRQQRGSEPDGGSLTSGCGDVGGGGEPRRGGTPARQRSWGHVYPLVAGLEGLAGNGGDGHQPGRVGESAGRSATKTGGAVRPWNRYSIVVDRKGKARRIEPGLAPLAHGVPGRVGLLRGYGNAIVPDEAAEFIQACEEVISNC